MKKGKMIMNRTLAGLMTAAMVVGVLPANVYAVTGDEVAADGTYTSTETVVNDSEDGDEWENYDVTVSVTVKDGKIEIIDTVADYEGDDNDAYFNKATVKKKGISTLLTGKEATENVIEAFDVVSSATCTSRAVKTAALEAIQSAPAAVTEEEPVVEINTADLETAIAAAEALTASDYTEDSYAAVSSALADAKAALEAKESQDAVDAAAKALNEAVSALEKVPEVPEVDTAALEEAIASAEVLNEADYTEDSYAAVSSALTDAKAALEAKESQDAVDAAAKALNDAVAALEKAPAEEEIKEAYVLMNIPYGEFYASEFTGGSNVDAVTTATKAKSKMTNLAAGTYHKADGSEITGITYPVHVSDMSVLEGYEKITDDSAKTISYSNHGNVVEEELTGKDVLFESATYAYYILAEEPAFYKELTVDGSSFSFGRSTAPVRTGSDVSATLATESSYGDYQLNVSGLSVNQIYGILINTEEGASYALRHIENMWRKGSQLAWSTGHKTTEVHGNTLSYENYKAMEGQTITSLTVYSDEGIVNYDIGELLVQKKSDAAVSVADGKVTDGSTAVTIEGIPEDYKAVFSVDGLAGAAVSDGVLSFDKETALPGSYTLVVTDESGVYASAKASFVLTTDEMPAKYNEDAEAPALVKEDGAKDADFANYLKNIASVTVDGTVHAATGRGAKKLINSEGLLDLDERIFPEEKTYEITVASKGYPDLEMKLDLSGYYVMMNIPYDEFYAAEITSDTPVDTVTSATTEKGRWKDSKNTRAGGTYRLTTEEGAEQVISGITFPVRVRMGTALSALVKADTAADLFVNATYAYTKLTEEPDFYKELTVESDGSFSFGKTVGEAKTVDAGIESFTTDSDYGDYEFILESFLNGDTVIYGVVVNTKEGETYGLRQVENIYKQYKLAWSVGFKTVEKHGNTLNYNAYSSLMGKTVTGFTYYTSEGIFNVAIEPTLLAEKGYVLMNIPYDEFYASEFTGGSNVDAVTSATTDKKTKNYSLFAGSYHADADGSQILGVTYPVFVNDMTALEGYEKITDETAVTVSWAVHGKSNAVDLTGSDTLFEAPTYSYYVLSEKPDFYKELTVTEDGFSFGRSTADVQEGSGVTASLAAKSSYGDYQLNISGMPKSKILGIVLNTKEGDSYAMRHLENIWRGGAQVAWSTGHKTTEQHGNALSYENFKAMEGQTITDLTVYTDEGIFNYDVEDMFVQKKTDAAVSVADGKVADGSTAVTIEDLPEDYKAAFSVDGLQGAAVSGSTLSFDKDAAQPGSYTLTVTDESGVYAALSASFTLTTDEMPAKYNEDNEAPALVKEDDAADAEFANYLKNISSVRVNDTVYAASGRGATKLFDAEGKLDTSAKPFAEGSSFEITVTSKGYEKDLTFKYERSLYVLMNIPYAEFYAADLNNDVDVDVYTSATLAKPKTMRLSGGSYHKADGSEITGVTFPVRVTGDVDLSAYTQVTDDDTLELTVTNRGQTSTTTYTGQDVLFESGTYAYYVLSEKPAFYKELTVAEDGSFAFGEVVGEVQALAGVEAELLTNSRYGDYQLNLDGITEAAGLNLDSDRIYGVIVSTKEGSDYGMRHLENLWRGSELAWCTGFTETVHGCPTSSDHYKAMMGQTISQVTYLTSKGIFTVAMDIYVPVKTDAALEVDDAALTAGKTTMTITDLPKDFDPVFEVTAPDGTVFNAAAITKTAAIAAILAADGDLTSDTIAESKYDVAYGSDAANGTYTMTVSDGNGKYAAMSDSFEIYSEDIPAEYNKDGTSPALVKTDDASENDFNDYISKITSVNVNGTDYPAAGRGAVKLFDENGKLDTSAAAFAEGDSFEINVTADGYADLAFTYSPSDQPEKEPEETGLDKSALEAAIKTADALDADDYTDESWSKAGFPAVLTTAKEVLASATTQEELDNAAKTLNAAIKALKKKSEEKESEEPETETETETETEKAADGSSKTNGSTKTKGSTKTNGSANGTSASGSSTAAKSVRSPKTGDPTSLIGLMGMAAASAATCGVTLKLRKKNKKDDDEE